MVSKITKTFLLGSFADFCHYLKTGNVNNPFTLFSNKFAIEHEMFKYRDTEDPCHSIRVYKPYTLFNCWYNIRSSEFVAALDYRIRPNELRIEYLNVNDDECSYKIKPITPDEAKILQKKLLEYVKDCAKKENKEKVIIDVHSNLRLYNKYYKEEGFEITGRRCSDNPFWEEVELKVGEPSFP